MLPQWLQDEQDIPHVELNTLGLRVPFWHDAVKLKLPSELQVADAQLTDNTRVLGSDMIVPGDKMLVAGYPYGFSANGQSQPTPVVLTRFVAAVNVPDRRRQYLLESIGGAGMSGGPVYVERGTDVLLVGLYTGLVYPDYLSPAPQLTTALGTVADISFHLHGHLDFLRPSVP